MAVCKADGYRLMWMGTKASSIPLWPDDVQNCSILEHIWGEKSSFCGNCDGLNTGPFAYKAEVRTIYFAGKTKQYNSLRGAMRRPCSKLVHYIVIESHKPRLTFPHEVEHGLNWELQPNTVLQFQAPKSWHPWRAFLPTHQYPSLSCPQTGGWFVFLMWCNDSSHF